MIIIGDDVSGVGSVSQYGTNISDTDVPAVLEMCRNTNYIYDLSYFTLQICTRNTQCLLHIFPQQSDEFRHCSIRCN